MREIRTAMQKALPARYYFHEYADTELVFPTILVGKKLK